MGSIAGRAVRLKRAASRWIFEPGCAAKQKKYAAFLKPGPLGKLLGPTLAENRPKT
jgi:hypothetical protein